MADSHSCYAICLSNVVQQSGPEYVVVVAAVLTQELVHPKVMSTIKRRQPREERELSVIAEKSSQCAVHSFVPPGYHQVNELPDPPDDR